MTTERHSKLIALRNTGPNCWREVGDNDAIGMRDRQEKIVACLKNATSFLGNLLLASSCLAGELAVMTTVEGVNH
jgi:hypothetical protein